MSGALFAIYFLFAPAPDLMQQSAEHPLLAARVGKRYLRWMSQGHQFVEHNGLRLATLSAAAKLVVDYQDEGFLRILMAPNLADNAVLFGPDALQVFVNGRKMSCRKEGDFRRLFFPILNNREPCER